MAAQQNNTTQKKNHVEICWNKNAFPRSIKKLWLANEYAWECEKYIFKFYYLTQLNSHEYDHNHCADNNKSFVAVESRHAHNE